MNVFFTSIDIQNGAVYRRREERGVWLSMTQ